MLYTCTKCRQNISMGFKVIEVTEFTEITKVRNSVKTMKGVTVLVLCTVSVDSGDDVYL